MTRWVVDTNVPVIANGRKGDGDTRVPTVLCRLSAVQFLRRLAEQHTVVLDLDGAVQSEYRQYLQPSGQPGVGDRFYQLILQSAPDRVQRVELPKRENGEYLHVPDSLIEAGFDPSDRKFVALACAENISIANATDSDWIEHAATLLAEGVSVTHLCGSDANAWLTDPV